MAQTPYLRGAAALPGRLARFGRDRRGTTAVEFGLVALPFFMLVLGVITIGLQYFTISSLESGLTTAARKLRTGEAQKSGLKVSDFRNLICNSAGSFISCDGSLVIHVKAGTTFADLNPPISCTSGSSLTPTANVATNAVSTYAGAASSTVLVTACYNWKLGSSLWKQVWGLLSVTPVNGGNTIISATTTFRTEPYQ